MNLKKILVKEIYLPIIYILCAIIIYIVLSAIIDKTIFRNKADKKSNNLRIKRKKTIVNLIKSILKYVIAIITILAILSVYGIETKSIVASLGIAGAIIGLAFQDTIKNLLSGITIIFDNHYVQGDVVTINGFRGEVIELGLQTTKLKSYEGEVLIINNCLVTSVINHSMYNKNIFIDLPIDKKVSIGDLEKSLLKVNEKLIKNPLVKKDIDLLGVEEIKGSKYIYKIMITCQSESHFEINRLFMQLLKEEFDKENIIVPGDRLEVKTDK